MEHPRSAVRPRWSAERPRRTRQPVGGSVLGALGILAFSFSFPATRLAVADLSPFFVAFGRAAVAGLMAIAVLRVGGAPRPTAAQWRSLALVAAGVVVGFPLLTSLALRDVPAGHSAVVIAMLPAATAVAAVLRAGERPPGRFWLAAGAGGALTTAFAASRGGGGLGAPDVELLAAVGVCALGYAEGGALARTLGGARTICWALVGSLPVTLAVAGAAAAVRPPAGGADAWLGFAYVSAVSMFLGFFAWYAGLARGGVARVGQIQLAQPLLTLGWSALLLGESVGVADGAVALGVLACVLATQRARAGGPYPAAVPSAAAAHVGKTYPPALYAVGREKIREYARAVGETDPLHLDLDAAREAGYADLVAPPMFAVVPCAEPVGRALFDPDLQIHFARLVHGSQEFTWEQLVVAGDEITTTLTLTAVDERLGNVFLTFVSDSVNQRGETTCTGTWSHVVRAA